MKNLLIATNAIGDIILSSELIIEAIANDWIVVIEDDFQTWTSTYLGLEINRLRSAIDVNADYGIVLDFCGQDKTIARLKNMASVQQKIGMYPNPVYDSVYDFAKIVTRTSVFEFYGLLQNAFFNSYSKNAFPIVSSLSSKKNDRHIELDLLIYPFSGRAEKNWDMQNFISVYEHFKSDGKIVKFLNPIPCNEKMSFIEKDDVISTSDWVESTDVIKGARVLLANDSSIAHIGSFIGVYTLSLFLKFDPRIWYPYVENMGLGISVSKMGHVREIIKLINAKL